MGQNAKNSQRANVVRFTPNSDRGADIRDRQLRANKRHMQRSKMLSLFDHLVDASEQRWWHVEAECLCSPEIDNQFELGRCLHRKVSRFLPPEDAINVARGAAVLVTHFRPVGDQAQLFALTTRIRRSTMLPDVLAICDEGRARLARGMYLRQPL